MDQMTMNRLAHIRLQEILEQSAKDRQGEPVRPVLRRFGGLLVTIGQKLMQANGYEAHADADNDTCGYSSLENEVCV